MAWSLVQSLKGTVGSVASGNATSSVTPSATGVGNLLICVTHAYDSQSTGNGASLSGAGTWSVGGAANTASQPGITVYVLYSINSPSINTSITATLASSSAGKNVVALNFYEFTNPSFPLSSVKMETLSFVGTSGSNSAPNPGTYTTHGLNEVVICGAVSGFVASTFTNCIQGTGYTIGKANATAQYQSAIFFATTDQYNLDVAASAPTSFATEATASWAATALGFYGTPGVPNSLSLLGSGT